MTKKPTDPEGNQGDQRGNTSDGYQTRLRNFIKYSFSGRIPGSGIRITSPYAYSGWIFALSIVLFFMTSLVDVYVSRFDASIFRELVSVSVLLLLLLQRRAFFILSCAMLAVAIFFFIH